MIIGRQLVNGYYEDEKLYSTGDNYLDDLLERAFCDGYEYAQKEFGNKENKAARKRWEAEQGRKASNYIEQFGGFKNATEVAKREIQLEKNGGTGSFISVKGQRDTPVDLTGTIEWAYKGKNWKDDVKPSSIPVSEDEILRRKYRDRLKVNDRKSKVTSADQAISKRGSSISDYDYGDAFRKKDYDFQDQKYLDLSHGRAKKHMSEDIEEVNKKQIYKDRSGNDSEYTKILKSKKNNKKVRDFIKNNKKGLAIGGAALGTAALVGGGIAIHRHNKKKKEQQEKENKED